MLPKLLVALALGAVMLAGILLAALWPDRVLAAVEGLLFWIRGAGALGWLALALLQTLVAAFGVVPASLLGVAAGIIYGLGLGFAISAASTLAGAAVSFVISRSMFRPMIERVMADRPVLRGLDHVLAEDGWRFVCLIRLSPIMPFAPTSYLLGLSAVPFRAFMLGTIASLPALFGYVLVGATAEQGLGAWRSGAGTLQWALLVIGVGAFVALTWRIGVSARRMLNSRLPS